MCLTACASTTEPPHTHTYSDGYAYNDTYHYHETTCGHDVAPENSDGYAKHSLVNGECSVCDYVQPLTLNEFVTDHNKAATDFIKNKIRPSVVGNNQVKAEQWYIEGNSNNELSEINMVWTYAVNEKDRKTQWANVTLADPIPFRNIANNKYSLNSSELDIDRTDIFEFDARTNYDKQNIAAAMYQKAELTADVKLYAEIDSGDGSYRSFKLLGQADSNVTVKRINVLKGDGSDDTLLNNINRPFTTMSTVNEYEVKGTNIYESAYALEDLGPEIEQPTPPDPIDPDKPEEKIKNVQDLIAKYASTVETALNDNYLYNIGRQCIGRAFKTEKVLYTEWYINSGESISKIEVVFKYDEVNGFVSYIIGTIELTSPINVKDLTKDTIASVLAKNSSDANYAYVYSFAYNDQMGTQRLELKNAICDKFFGENEGAIRYIKDNGTTISYELGEIRRFTVVQVTDKSVKSISISIKGWSLSDDQYINSLSDSSNYSYSSDQYEINGEKVQESKAARTKTSINLLKYITNYTGNNGKSRLA